VNVTVRDHATHVFFNARVTVDVIGSRKRKRPTLKWECAEMLVVLKTHGAHVSLGARLNKSNAQEHVPEISTAWSIVSLMSLRMRKRKRPTLYSEFAEMLVVLITY